MASILINESDDEILNPFNKERRDTSDAFVAWGYEGMCCTYGVKAEWTANGKTETLQQQIKMTCIRKGNEGAVWEINKLHFFVNGFKSENPMYELSVACSALIYPVQFLITPIGKTLPQPINLKALQSRFKEGKHLLHRDFAGNIAAVYINETEASLQQAERVQKLLTDDLWMCLFYTQVTGKYPNGSRQQQITVPILGYKAPVIFNCTAAVDKTLTAWNTVALRCAGSLALEELPAQFKYNYQPTGGDIEIEYDLERQTNRIQNIICRATILSPGRGDISLKMTGYKLENENDKEIPPPTRLKEKPWKWYSIFDI